MTKYPKNFEEYWKNARGANFSNLEQYQWEEIKHVAFLAWKAGQNDIRKIYDRTGTVYKRHW